MQTQLTEEMRQNARALEADSILRACVHCGFCTATCPTYQLLGDELDGPRGRIYLIKQVLEGNEVTLKTQEHLDRCLTCRNCETTCPSGVRYHNLLDIGRDIVEQKVKRPLPERILREGLRQVVPRPAVFRALTLVGLVSSHPWHASLCNVERIAAVSRCVALGYWWQAAADRARGCTAKRRPIALRMADRLLSAGLPLGDSVR